MTDTREEANRMNDQHEPRDLPATSRPARGVPLTTAPVLPPLPRAVPPRHRADALPTRVVAVATGVAASLGLVVLLVPPPVAPGTPTGSVAGANGVPPDATTAADVQVTASDVAETAAPSPLAASAQTSHAAAAATAKPKSTTKVKAGATAKPAKARVSSTPPAKPPAPVTTAGPGATQAPQPTPAPPAPTPKPTPAPTPAPTPVPSAASGKP